MRHVLWLLALSTAACGSIEYRDTNAAVDANPLCASAPDRPGEPVSQACERKSETTLRSGRDGSEVDFKRKSGDDD